MLNSTQQNTSFQMVDRLGTQRIPCYYGTHNSLPCLKDSADKVHIKPHKSTAHQCKLFLQTPFKYPYSYMLRSCKKHLIRDSNECISHLSVTVMARLRVVCPRDGGLIASCSNAISCNTSRLNLGITQQRGMDLWRLWGSGLERIFYVIDFRTWWNRAGFLPVL